MRYAEGKGGKKNLLLSISKEAARIKIEQNDGV